MAFPTLGNSDHVVVSVSIDFLSNAKRDALFQGIAYDFSVKAKILANVPGKEMVTNKGRLNFCEMIKPLITFFKISCFKLELLGLKEGTVPERLGTFLG